MVIGENVAKQQRLPNLRDSGHIGAHDPHLSPYRSLGKVLPRHA